MRLFAGVVQGGLVAYELHKLEPERSEIYIYDLAVAEPARHRAYRVRAVGDRLPLTIAPFKRLGPEWPRLRQLCVEKQLKGNAVADVRLAAATNHLGENLVSFDRDVRKLIGSSQFTLLEPDGG